MSARGGIRRAFIRARDAAEDWVVAARSGLHAQPLVYLARFGEPHEYERFQVTTDRVLGGSTDCRLTLKPYASFSAGLFEGVIDYSDDNPQSRGGFASFRTKPDERERRLGAYEALEMRIKTDGRPYILNLKCAEFSPEHLWQMRIVTPPSRWTTVALPFDELMLTQRGRVELEQREINRDSINGFGILLADGRNGPFRFEIQYLRALATFDPAAYASPQEQLIGEERARLAAGGSAPAAGGDGSWEAGGGGRGGGDGSGSGGGARRPPVDPEAPSVDGAGLVSPPDRPPTQAQLKEFYRQQREAARLK